MYTKWIEVLPTQVFSSAHTIKILHNIFTEFDDPVTLIINNAAQLCSEEFEQFLKSNGIVHKYSLSYHRSSNDHAERYVQTIKRGLHAKANEDGNFETKLCRFLNQYRKTPRSCRGVSPAEMFKDMFRTRLDSLKRRVPCEDASEVDGHSKKFHIGDEMRARLYVNKNVFILAKVGDVLYKVLTDERNTSGILISYVRVNLQNF